MIEVDPEAALELLEARDFYEKARPGLGAIFELAAQRTLDAVESAPERFPIHPFAATADRPSTMSEPFRRMRLFL